MLYLVPSKSSMLDGSSGTHFSGKFRQTPPVTPKRRCLESTQDYFAHGDEHTTEARTLVTKQNQVRSKPWTLIPFFSASYQLSSQLLLYQVCQ